MQVKIKRLSKDIPIPQYQTPGSVAFDLISTVETTIAPHDIQLIPTGLIVKIPEGYMLMIASRSSLPLKKGLTMANCVGIVDQDYHGPQDEIKVPLLNLTGKPVQIAKDERFAQAVFVKIEVATLEQAEDLENNNNRGGFGSTAGYNA